MNLVRVALSVPLYQFFDYLYYDNKPVIGARVLVPFGNQKLVGIVIDLPKTTNIPKENLKTIIQVLDMESLFTTELWELLDWAAKYYQAPLGEVLNNALPVRLRQGQSAVQKTKTFFNLTALGHQVLREHLLKSARKQREALQMLAVSPLEKDMNDFSKVVWSALKVKGYVEETEAKIDIMPWQTHLGHLPIAKEDNRLVLNQEQALALSQLIFHQGFVVWLIDGVTGSGKTEIYLQHIEEVLKKGQQVLVLVPEIGLTPQTVQRFQARFNVEIDVLHSNLNDTQRLRVWQRAKTAESAVVIGTRSALFTPFDNLGLIVIDEEHDSSFKQQDGWRYHARDLAVVYGKKLDIPIVLGSATPSLESLNNVKQAKYKHILLKKRAGNGTALRHAVIDLKKQRVHNGVSDALLDKMKIHLEKGNQVLLFLNRRGFAPVLFCHECGWIAECQQCDKPYTYHQKQGILRCHHCGSQKPIPRQCAHCGSTHLMTTGIGTEQLENTLAEYFPDYQITRIDRDSISRKGALERHLKDIQQGKSQILIGTQMLAKGHHFPNVTLVGLLNVDNALFSLDFRAEERLAQLYIQVSGRAGRAEKKGEVVLQTHYPEHPLLVSLLSQGYGEFSEQALNVRRVMGLPPFSAQAMFKAQSKVSQDAEQLLNELAEKIHHFQIPALQILGPLPAPFSKKAGQYRWQLLLQAPSKSKLQQVLLQLKEIDVPISHKVRLILDVDPFDLT